MGEVYRARDTKLERDVAIKIIPDALAEVPDRLARFAREAKVLASLNHPNIAAIYGVEDRALILELVEGPTLADVIARGPIAVEEALPMARQMAEALEYAHERGVVHRDLKPANVKIHGSQAGLGRVKVLDFGLAKASAGDSSDSETETMTGVVMGTPAYMSPEQAQGKRADRRSDIWSFGLVLFEMLTGKRLPLAALIAAEPDLSGLPETTPAPIRRLLRRCLERDPQLRLQWIGEARVAIERAQAGEETVEAAAAAGRAAWWQSPAWVSLAAIFALAFAALAVIHVRGRSADHPLTRLSVDLGADAVAGQSITVAISPDGRRIVFPMRAPDGKQDLATRALDQAQPTLLAETEGGSDPFFSPDGQWIGFFAGGSLKKISVQGGVPVTLCSVDQPRGASWGDDGNLVVALAPLMALSRVPAAGGAPARLTKLAAGEVTHRWPQVLPGGEAVIFTASPAAVIQENAKIEAFSLKTGKTKVLVSGGYYGRYLPSGHIVYVHQGALFGVGFDASKLAVRGSPVPLLDDLAANPISGGGEFDFSSSGTLAYLAGKAGALGWQLEWLDSSGKLQPIIEAPGTYTVPRISPDGTKLAYFDGADIYVRDLRRDTTTRLTFTGGVGPPVWTPDGRHIVFQELSSGYGIGWVRSDGAGEPQRLLTDQNVLVPWSFSPDGRRLAYFEASADQGYNIWTVALDNADTEHPKAGKPELFLDTPANEDLPRFSPDGRWIAYRSDESGRNEIYVRPFRPGVPAGSGGKWQASAGGGRYPLWSNNGHELFYEAPDNRIMAVDYATHGDAFEPGKPRLWSGQQIFYPGTSNLDIAPGGKRFAVFSMPEAAGGVKGSVHVTFLLNFFDELKRKIPAK